MGTPRTSRQSSSTSTPAPATSAKSQGKPSGSSEKNRPPAKQAKHRSNSATFYGRSAKAVARKIAAIKRKLVREAPSQEVIDDFFEGVTSEPSFVFEFRSGPKWLQDAIARACEEILDKPTGESTVYLVAVPDHDLVHGSVVVDGYTGAAVFFEDIRLGAVGLYPDEKSRGGCFVRLVMVDDARKSREPPN